MSNRTFEPGTVVYHKATGDRCVVIEMNKDNTVKVRTEKDLERDYHPQELKTEGELENEARALNAKNEKDWSIG